MDSIEINGKTPIQTVVFPFPLVLQRKVFPAYYPPNSRPIMNKTAAALLFSFFACTAAHARLEPSFHLETAAWNATDIVVVEGGDEIDDAFLVAEMLQGELKVGDEVVVPELAEFRDKAARRIWLWKEGAEPQYVSGDRMILFLTRDEPETSADEVKWLSSMLTGSYRHAMKLSVVWVEGKKAYAIQQKQNPGPAAIFELPQGSAGVAAEIKRLVSLKKKLAAATATEAASERADLLAEFAVGKDYFARHEAFAALQNCEAAAESALLKIIDNPKHAAFHGDAIDCLGHALKDNATPILINLLKEETEFWRNRGPDLSVGWWNGQDLKWPEVKELRDQFRRLSAALRVMAKHPQPEYAKPVAELRDFWRTLPQLEDPSGLNQISHEADAVLNQIKSKS